jgi:hypothetical protein
MAAAAGRVRTECRNRFDDPVLCCKWCESKQSATWNAAVPVQFPKWPFSWPETPPMPASPHALATGLRDVQRLDFHAAVPLFLKPDETSPSPIITPCQFANRHSGVCFSIAFRAGHRHFSRETISKPTSPEAPMTSMIGHKLLTMRPQPAHRHARTSNRLRVRSSAARHRSLPPNRQLLESPADRRRIELYGCILLALTPLASPTATFRA